MEDLEKIKDEEKETKFEEGDTRTPAEENLDNQNEQPEPNPIEEEKEEVKEVKEEVVPEPAQEESIAGEGEGAAQTPEETNIEPKEEMFTQSQVNELVGRARKEGRESAMKALFERYGVDTEDEMNEVFGKGQIYADLNDEFETEKKSRCEMQSENALLKSGINPERWDDVKAILGAKGLEISVENITQMLPTHQEWKGAVKVSDEEGLQNGDIIGSGEKEAFMPKPEPIKVTKLGTDPSPKQEKTDQELAEEIFGYKFNK